MTFNGIIYKDAKPLKSSKPSGKNTYNRAVGQSETIVPDVQEGKPLKEALKTRGKNFLYKSGVTSHTRTEHKHATIPKLELHTVEANHISGSGSMLMRFPGINHPENVLDGGSADSNSSTFVVSVSNAHGDLMSSKPEHLWTKRFGQDFPAKGFNHFQLSRMVTLVHTDNPVSFNALRESKLNKHQYCIDTGLGRKHGLDDGDTELAIQCLDDDLYCGDCCDTNHLEPDYSSRLVATPVSSGYDTYRVEKDYMPILNTGTQDIFSPDGAGFQHFIFAALVIKHLGKDREHLDSMELFRPFYSFVPETLLMGYVLLCRYPYGFESDSDLVDMFLACCIVSSKIRIDLHLSSINLVRGWDVPISKVNYLEAFLTNAIDYDVFVNDEEARNAASEIRQTCFEFGIHYDGHNK